MSSSSFLSAFFLVCFVSIIINGKEQKSEEEVLNEWIGNQSSSSLNYYKRYHPDRLRTTTQNMAISSKIISDFRDNIDGVVFATPFTNNTVLQRAPQHSALYGLSCAPNIQISLMMKNEESGQSTIYTTISMNNGDWKFLLPKTFKNGGNYTFTVSSTSCNTTQQQTIYNVTFGDVYYCAGQSNMQLEMFHTFNRNYTYDNITQLGKYKNIRFYLSPSNCVADENISFVSPINNQPNGRYKWQQVDRIDLLNMFASPCWYFAQVLSDKYSLSNTTFGLISTAVGGSIIESWIANHTINNYCKPNGTVPISPGFGCLYNGLVLPYINYTIKAALWYQGENDVGRYPTGNILNNTGYACSENLMIKQWRANWSVVDSTTDPLFHFGLVTLAAGTSEGHQPFMGDMRWSQSLNYDILPNEESLNTFIAQGYDIGEPWSKNCGAAHICNTTTAPYSTVNTHWLDGPIHPRPKIYVGQRLARGANKFIYGRDEIWSGPLISGCTLDLNNNEIEIEFNKTMLYDESVIIQQWSPWYNISIPPPLHWTAIELLINETQWIYSNDNALKKGTNDDYSVILDVSEFNGMKINGLRYAWNDYPCCGELNKEYNPCPMNSCPIVSSKTLLPAPPIWAKIENNKCVCYAPQKC